MIDPTASAARPSTARPSTAFKIFFSGGIGDALLTSPALRALKQRFPQLRVDLLCATQVHADIFQHNPNVDRLSVLPNRDQRALWAAEFGYAAPGGAMGPPDYKRVAYSVAHPTLQRKHATELIAEMLDLSLTDRRLEIFLTPDEEALGRRVAAEHPRRVAIHITSLASANQHWPMASWEELVRRNPHYTFLQLGHKSEPSVAGCVDLRGKLTVRESIAVLKFSRAFVGVVSSMAHATNAVDTPAVVLFGPSAPEIWAHPNQRVLTRRLRCAPCIDSLGRVPCPYAAPCLSEISVSDVEAALDRQANSRADLTA